MKKYKWVWVSLAVLFSLFLTAYRKNGIGKKLLEKTEKSLQKEGIRKTFLVAFKKNNIGNIFWEATGYKNREDLNYRDKKIMD